MHSIKTANATHFADVLAVASSSANTNVAMMGETFKYVGAASGSLGYSIEDVALGIGLMANSGIKASQAGTELKTQDIGMPHSGSHIHKTHDLTCSHHGGTVTGTTGEATGPAPDPPIPSERTAGGDSSDGMHQHHVLIPEKMRQIKPGDRVLVAWVQSEAVVIDIVLPGTAVKG